MVFGKQFNKLFPKINAILDPPTNVAYQSLSICPKRKEKHIPSCQKMQTRLNISIKNSLVEVDFS